MHVVYSTLRRLCARGFGFSVKSVNVSIRRGQEGSGDESWTPLIGQSLDDDKCFLQDERDALERSDETEKTKPFA